MDSRIEVKKLEGTDLAIDDGTPIVRYMKLETFLLLLAGQVFIPSHDLLTSLDPLESKLVFGLPHPWRFWEDHAKKIYDRILWNPAGSDPFGPRKIPKLKLPRVTVRKRSVAEDAKAEFRTWLSALSRLRCVWCWNRFESHSYALWQLYGNRGVAVHGTVGAVKTALLDSGVRRGIVAPVSYVNVENRYLDKVFSNWENVFFPHLLKSVSFEYEKEIRFILRAHWHVIAVQKGVMIAIDTSSIIPSDGHVTVSPQLQPDEQVAVREIIRRTIEERRVGTKKRIKLSEDWLKLYSAHREAPFPTEDPTPGFFKDLD